MCVGVEESWKRRVRGFQPNFTGSKFKTSLGVKIGLLALNCFVLEIWLIHTYIELTYMIKLIYIYFLISPIISVNCEQIANSFTICYIKCYHSYLSLIFRKFWIYTPLQISIKQATKYTVQYRLWTQGGRLSLEDVGLTCSCSSSTHLCLTIAAAEWYYR